MRLVSVFEAFGMVLSLSLNQSYAVVDKPSTNGALHLVDAMIERLVVLHQRSELTMCFGGHVNRFEFIHGGHTGEREGIVFIGLTFDVTPLPSIFVGGADKGFEPVADRQVIDPTGRPACVHDDDVDFVFLKRLLS
jgi:hypothetical protein